MVLIVNKYKRLSVGSVCQNQRHLRSVVEKVIHYFARRRANITCNQLTIISTTHIECLIIRMHQGIGIENNVWVAERSIQHSRSVIGSL